MIDVNLIYTTLQETGDGHEGTVLQLPNNLFFQRTVRAGATRHRRLAASRATAEARCSAGLAALHLPNQRQRQRQKLAIRG